MTEFEELNNIVERFQPGAPERVVNPDGTVSFIHPTTTLPNKDTGEYTGPVNAENPSAPNPLGTPPTEAPQVPGQEVAPFQPDLGIAPEVVPPIAQPVQPQEAQPVTTPFEAPAGAENAAQGGMSGGLNVPPEAARARKFTRMESLITGANAAPNNARPAYEGPTPVPSYELTKTIPQGAARADEIAALQKIADEFTEKHMTVQKAAGEYAVGFADKVARRIGGSADAMTMRPVVDRALVAIGTRMMDNPDELEDALAKGRMEEKFVDLLHRMGVPKADMANLFTEIGSEQVDSFIMLAALRAVGPRLQAMGDTGKVRRFFKRLGDSVVQKPISMALMDMFGATPGSVAGRRLGNEMAPDSYTGGLTGSILGSTSGSAVAYKILKWIQAPGRTIQSIKRMTKLGPASPLVNQNAIPESARVYSDQQHQDDLLRIENSIQHAINTVPRPTGNPRDYQEAVYQALDRADRVADGVERSYWNRVGVLGNRVPPGIAQEVNSRGVITQPGSGFLHELDALEREQTARYHLSEVPSEVYDRIRGYYPGFYDPAQRTVTYRTNIQTLRNEVRAIRREIREEWAKISPFSNGVPNQPKIAAMNQITSLLQAQIQNAGGADRDLQNAIGISREVYRLFGQGTIPKLLSTARSGESGVRPYRTVEAMLSNIDGLEDVLKMSQQMRTSAAWRAPSATGVRGRPLLTGAQMGDLTAMESDVAQSIRAGFHEQIDNAKQMGKIDQKEAMKLLNQLEPQVRPLAHLSTQIHAAGMRLAAIQEEQRVIGRSAFARFAGMDADKAIMNIMAQKDPAGVVRTLVDGNATSTGMRRDPAAMEGIKTGFMNYWLNNNMKNGSVDAVKFQKFLADGKITRIQEQLWRPEEIRRLDKLVDIAVRSERGEIASWSQRALPTTRIISRILGAHGGRMVNATMGGSTLQAPSMGARLFSEKATAFLQTFNPSVTLANAMYDPHYEALMLRTEPVPGTDGVTMLKVLRNHLRRAEALRQSFQDDWETRMLNEPAEDKRLKQIIKDFR